MTDIIKPAKLNIVLDASKIDLFETCPARYNYRHNHNKILPILYKNKALDLGGLAHEGLAVYYQTLAENIPYPERVALCINKIRELAADPNQSNSSEDEVNNLITSVEQCLDFWRPEDENQLEILAVEQPFAYELYSDDLIRFILSGKIDLLVNFHGIGRQQSYQNLPIDHKTYSRDSMVMQLSNQFINYANAVGSNYLIVNRVGLHSSDVKKPKTPEEKFKRLPMSYDPIFIQDWKDNLIKMLSVEYLGCIENDYWPMKPTSCNKFNRLCEYYEGICSRSGWDSKLAGLRDNYIDAPQWDVTSNLGQENK